MAWPVAAAPAAAIDGLDWPAISAQLDEEGHAVLPGLLNAAAARRSARQIRILGAPQRLPPAPGEPGRGELFHFGTRLPAPWGGWRTAFYRHLAVIANRWNDVLGVGARYPEDLEAFLQRNREAGRVREQSHLNRLRAEEYMPLHRGDAGAWVFPLQVVALLSEPGADFQGGEFVMTEQRPRRQSRPMVLPLALGDAAIIGTAARPSRGAGGYCRVHLRHAVSRVHRGERIGVELTFHLAP